MPAETTRRNALLPLLREQQVIGAALKTIFTKQAVAVERDMLRSRVGRPLTTYRMVWRGHSKEIWSAVQEEVRTRISTTVGKAILEDPSAWTVTKGPPPNEEETLASLRHQTASDLISSRLSSRSLSERVYHTQALSDKQVHKVIQKAIAFNWDQKKLAEAVKDLVRPDVPGGVSYAAERLALTELQNAYHESQRRLYQMQPWVTGVKWNISSTHPEKDECDLWKDRVFDKKKVPDKPHPNCLCYITSVSLSDQDFARAILSGTLDRALAATFGKGTGPALRARLRAT